MRLLTVSLLAAAMAFSAHAQTLGMIGPSFAPSSVKADNFDAVFDVKVNTLPSIPVLWNQTADARWDGVVCNVGKENRGAVKVEPTARFGYLDLNTCTMFSNFHMLDLTTVDPDKEWTARVYLRARK
ncbi:MAG: hypothetical protein EON93_10880 [Burkholderiales bacterium]|nr:MAG: hypothetical protein EON93_10880 [Burkholderiales bacterium]